MKKSQYQLKGKYNGLDGLTNDTLTNAQAEKLLKTHPRGVDLFAKLPKELQKQVDAKLAEAKKAEAELHQQAALKKAEDRKQMAAVPTVQGPSAQELQAQAEEARAKVLQEAEEAAQAKRNARLEQLLTWPKDRLVKKAKALQLTATGSVTELAKRIHKHE